MENRPVKDELVERMFPHDWYVDELRPILLSGNILPDSTAAPALQGQQRELQRHMRSDSLEQKLQQRPKPEELIKEGILESDEDPTK